MSYLNILNLENRVFKLIRFYFKVYSIFLKKINNFVIIHANIRENDLLTVNSVTETFKYVSNNLGM